MKEDNIYCSEDELKAEMIKLKKVEELKTLLEDGSNPERVKQLQDEGIDPNYKKTKFGEMALQIINRLATKHNFGGYTSSWKVDMISNAVEKVMAYAIRNFNPDKISKTSGEPVKAFAYVTQIASNAFVETIKILKQEQATIEELIKYDDHAFEYHKQENKSTIDDIEPEIDLQIYFWSTIDNVDMLMIGRGKNIMLPHRFPEGCYIETDKDYNILGWGEFTDIYTICKKHKDKYLKIVYPETYVITNEEYNNIRSLNMTNLHISQYRNTYIPSFPKREKKSKDTVFDAWDDINNDN